MAKVECCGDGYQCPESWKLWDDSEYTLPDSCDDTDVLYCSPLETAINQPKGKLKVNPMAQITKMAHMSRLNQLEKSRQGQQHPVPRNRVKPWSEVVLPSKSCKKSAKSKTNTPVSDVPKPAEKQLAEDVVQKPTAIAKTKPFHEKRVQPLRKQLLQVSSKLRLNPYEMKFLEPSERIMRLVALKVNRELPKPVTRGAMRYKATERIKELAKARKRPSLDRDPQEKPFAVSMEAIIAKTTPRLEKLAQPRKYIDIHTRSNPHVVSRSALKAKASPRTSELAQPRYRGR